MGEYPVFTPTTASSQYCRNFFFASLTFFRAKSRVVRDLTINCSKKLWFYYIRVVFVVCSMFLSLLHDEYNIIHISIRLHATQKITLLVGRSVSDAFSFSAFSGQFLYICPCPRARNNFCCGTGLAFFSPVPPSISWCSWSKGWIWNLHPRRRICHRFPSPICTNQRSAGRSLFHVFLYPKKTAPSLWKTSAIAFYFRKS